MNGQSIKYISLFEAAKLTSYSQEYISLLCRQKKLKGTKIGRNWVTTKEWVRDYIDRTKGNGQNVIPVKIKSAENTPAGDSIPPFMGKLILTAIICSLFVSSFIFVQLGFQREIIKVKPLEVIAGLNLKVSEKIITLSDSLDTIKNEVVKFSDSKVANISGFALRLHSPAGTMEPAIKFAASEIISLSNSLNIISNHGKNVIKFSLGNTSTRIKNNLENLAEPLRTKLARLPRSKDIIFAAVSGGTNINKSERGRVAGVSTENLSDRLYEEPPQPPCQGGRLATPSIKGD